MHYTRWNDQDNYTRLLMNTLEQLEDDVKVELASDLIQLIVQSNYSSNLDMLVKEVGEQPAFSKRRWYDHDETVFSSVKMLKYISKHASGDNKKDILSEFLFSLISYNKNPMLIEAKS